MSKSDKMKEIDFNAVAARMCGKNLSETEKESVERFEKLYDEKKELDEKSGSVTEGNLPKTVTDIIEEVCEDICDNYCKYRETADDDLECDAIRQFGKCPLDRLH